MPGKFAGSSSCTRLRSRWHDADACAVIDIVGQALVVADDPWPYAPGGHDLMMLPQYLRECSWPTSPLRYRHQEDLRRGDPRHPPSEVDVARRAKPGLTSADAAEPSRPFALLTRSRVLCNIIGRNHDADTSAGN